MPELPSPQQMLQGMLIALLMDLGGSYVLPADAMSMDVLGTPDGRLHALELEKLENGRMRLSVVPRPWDLPDAGIVLRPGVDRGPGLLRQRKDCATAGETAAGAGLTAVDCIPAFVDRECQPVVPPTTQVVEESHAAGPGTARRVLIAMVARAAALWNRLRPERR
jgi:hypothetical protein